MRVCIVSWEPRGCGVGVVSGAGAASCPPSEAKVYGL